LGRGLEALLGRVATKPESTADPASPEVQVVRGPTVTLDNEELAASPAAAEETLRSPTRRRNTSDTEVDTPGAPLRLPLREIESNPFQPRQDFGEEELQSLCDSLRAHGLLQPVVVRRVGDGYQLVAGERRLRAAAKAGWVDVPVQLIEADDQLAAELAIVENLQRKDLGPLEKAASFQQYLENYGCTQEELAGRLKLDRSTIANLIRLLELPGEVQDALRQGKITPGHARALLPLGDEREQVAFCQRIHAEGLSVRDTEALVQQSIDQADDEPLSVAGRVGQKTPSRRPTSEHVAALEQELRLALGVRAKLTHNARGKGKLVIHFASHEEFEQIREHICGRGQPESRNRAG
jgi:ParB family chromosome partitioning protein